MKLFFHTLKINKYITYNVSKTYSTWPITRKIFFLHKDVSLSALKL